MGTEREHMAFDGRGDFRRGSLWGSMLTGSQTNHHKEQKRN